MTETKMGILAPAPEAGRAVDWDVALSSGVVELIMVLDALQWGSWHMEGTQFLAGRFQRNRHFACAHPLNPAKPAQAECLCYFTAE